MKRFGILAICVAGVFLYDAPRSDAYELATHAGLTKKIYERSQLASDPAVLKALGLSEYDPQNVFGSFYYDFSGGRVTERTAQKFEATVFEEIALNGRFSVTAERSIAGWLMRGAVREDDLSRTGCLLGNAVEGKLSFGCNPQDDPEGDIDRVLNHFFDPYFNRGLTTFFTTGLRSPDWATGAADAFASPNVPNAGRRNHFTVMDAREAMYRALTGQRDPRKSALTETERKTYWATTFRALGDVLHLVEDMAQPQHTRNEPHPGSTYEKYIDARALGTNSFTIGGTAKQWDPLVLDGHPIPTITKYSELFSTSPGTGSLSGKGLADYSNRGFFTQNKNLGSSGALAYPQPSSDRSGYIAETVIPSDGQLAGPLTIRFLRGDVADRRTESINNIKMTTESIFSRPNGVNTATYSLVRENFDDQAALLLPRAVAYGAAFLDYFFRGKLDYVDDPQSTGVKRIRNLSKESMTGTFAFYYDAADGNRYPVPNAKWESITLPPYDATITDAGNPAYGFAVAFNPPVDPAPKNDAEYMLVFNGDLGEEKAENGSVGAVAAKAIKGPSGDFIVTPSYVPADSIQGTRAIAFSGGQWRLSTDQGLVGGNVDWKGQYVNGNPTKVLTWRGNPARLVIPNDGYPTEASNEIYQDGEVYAVAPRPVLGAALQKDGTGREWVVAITVDGKADVVYRKPSVKSSSAALNDPVTNPAGWVKIGEFPALPDAGYAQLPWFFNGAGTEAQTMRRRGPSSAPGLDRYKISVGAEVSSASFANLENFSTRLTGLDTRVGQCAISPPATLTCEGTSYGISSEQRNKRVWDMRVKGQYVVAVDYLDNQELLGNLVIEKYHRESDENTSKGTTLGAFCVGANFQYATSLTEGQRHYSNDQTTSVRFESGQFSVDLTPSSEIFTVDGQGSQTCRPNQDPTCDPVKGSQAGSRLNRTKPISMGFLDMRYGIAVTQNKLNEIKETSSSTSENGVDSGANTYLQTLRTSNEVSAPSVSRSGALEESVRQFTFPLNPFQIQLSGPITNIFCDTPIPPRVVEEIFSLETYWHQPTYGPPSGSWVVGKSGRMLLTQPGFDGNGGVLNYLTGGSLPDVIPGARPNARYNPVYPR